MLLLSVANNADSSVPPVISDSYLQHGPLFQKGGHFFSARNENLQRVSIDNHVGGE
jgi:hypothetical protein